MNLAETHDLLTFVAAVDNRRFGDDTVIAWQSIIGDLQIDEAREAARRHFRNSTDYLSPGHIRAEVLKIREERRPHHEVLALPSRFEVDDERVQRVKRGIAACAAAIGRVWRPVAVRTDTEDRVLPPARRKIRSRPALLGSVPPPTTTIGCAICSGRFIDSEDGHQAHRVVFGHRPESTDRRTA